MIEGGLQSGAVCIGVIGGGLEREGGGRGDGGVGPEGDDCYQDTGHGGERVRLRGDDSTELAEVR